jgi:transcriptional regulator with XRE-family HTH domain
VSTLGSTIRKIRHRQRLNMTEFAELIGADQSTISRYESGQVLPSKTVLILLFLLAEEEERAVIADATGGVDLSALKARLTNSEEILRAVARNRSSARKKSGAEEVRTLMAEESASLVSSGKPIEPALVAMLRLFREHGNNKRLRKSLVQMLPYF